MEHKATTASEAPISISLNPPLSFSLSLSSHLFPSPQHTISLSSLPWEWYSNIYHEVGKVGGLYYNLASKKQKDTMRDEMPGPIWCGRNWGFSHCSFISFFRCYLTPQKTVEKCCCLCQFYKIIEIGIKNVKNIIPT